MRMHFIKPHQKDRDMVRCRVLLMDDAMSIREVILNRGYRQVGIVKFFLHQLFWWKKPRRTKGEIQDSDTLDK